MAVTQPDLASADQPSRGRHPDSPASDIEPRPSALRRATIVSIAVSVRVLRIATIALAMCACRTPVVGSAPAAAPTPAPPTDERPTDARRARYRSVRLRHRRRQIDSPRRHRRLSPKTTSVSPIRRARNLAVVELLLARSADTYARDKRGPPPRHPLGRTSNTVGIDPAPFVAALLAHCANADRQDDRGITLLGLKSRCTSPAACAAASPRRSPSAEEPLFVSP